LVTGFRGYAFCKAHSTAYGVEAYEAAWLKRYYPTEFLAAVLTNGKGFYTSLVYVLECHRLGIRLQAPCVNEPGPAFTPHVALAPNGPTIRVPVTRVKGLSERTIQRLLVEYEHEPFASLQDFYRRVAPLPEEMESLSRVGAFDCFGQSRTAQFWECQFFRHAYGPSTSGQGWLFPLPGPNAKCQMPNAKCGELQTLNSKLQTPNSEVSLVEPTRRQRLEWEAELLDFCASGHPLELHDDIAWESYCSVAELGNHIGERVVTCGLVIEQRVHHQVTGEPMKFLTLADWTGMAETELFAPTYKSYGLATVRYPVLEVTATVEPFENGRGFSLRVHRAGKPRMKKTEDG
jgi:DNA polymerase III alpha subunit